MIRQAIPFVPLMACLCLACSLPAAGQEASSEQFRIKPSEVAIPADVPLGQYSRTIRPFENWTLICDTNLKLRQRVCNVSQTLEDSSGKMAFSWSLAATKEGQPFMILRTPPTTVSSKKLQLGFEGRKNPVQVVFDGCNEAVCVATLPVGPILREQIGKGAGTQITYTRDNETSVIVNAPLKGLSSALSAIK
jgi:invasion protein IalB